MGTNSDSLPTSADYVRCLLLRLRVVRGLSKELISAIVIHGITDAQIRAWATNAKSVPNGLVEFFATYVSSNLPVYDNRKSTVSVMTTICSMVSYITMVSSMPFFVKVNSMMINIPLVASSVIGSQIVIRDQDRVLVIVTVLLETTISKKII